MTDDAAQNDKPSLLHRPIPNRVMEWLLIGLLLCIALFVLITPVCTPHTHPLWIQDHSNIKQIVIALQAYATDHDNRLPTTMVDLHDYLGPGSDELFRSRYDHEDQLVFDDTPEPGWYAYGSYWFRAEATLSLEDVTETDRFILAYRTPRTDHDMYVVGFREGGTMMMSRDEFKALMQEQGGFVNPGTEQGLERQLQ